jgi:hypothetical protein
VYLPSYLNAGVKNTEQKNIWVDAGIFASHIGFRGAIVEDCPTLHKKYA